MLTPAVPGVYCGEVNVFLVVISLLVSPAMAQQAPLVTVDPVVRTPLVATVPVVGRFVATRRSVVSARAAGAVASVAVQVGERVRAGQVLARLDAQVAAAVRDESAAVAATRRAELDLARMERRRLEPLRNSAASRANFENARQQEAIARARLAQAEAAASRARLNHDYTVITAPYDGVVTRKYAEAGAHLAVGGPVVDLLDDNSLEIEVEVLYNRVGGLAPGVEVDYRAGGEGRPAGMAVVRAVVPDENSRTRTRTVRLMPRVGGGAAAGQSVTVDIPAGRPRDALTLHKDAVVQRGGANFVFVVNDGAAAMTPVQLGQAVGGRLEVVDGVGAGDLVIIRGNERLPPRGPVQVTPPQ